MFGHISDRFSDLFSLFETILRVKLNIFGGNDGGDFVLQTCRPKKF